MNILLAGGTGFVGQQFMSTFTKQDHHIYNVTRNPESYQNSETTTYIGYDHPVDNLPTIDAVINLAGESLFGYWTAKKKDAILRSRIETTEKVVDMMTEMKIKPHVFINGSAVGFYGTSDDMIFTEETRDAGNDFLADVVGQWENTARKAEDLNVRTIYARFGLILGSDGALPLMSLPVKLFVGGKIGSGDQWISWIHVQDVVNLLIHCIETKEISGPINFTAPNPKRNKDFTKKLASVLKRPYYFPTPAVMIRLAMGEMSELITKGQYVLPKQAEKYHFTFTYPHLNQALEIIFQK